MRRLVCMLGAIALLLSLLTGEGLTQIKGELVSTTMIWGEAPISRDCDLVRFKDRWFVVFCELSDEFSRSPALRVISSKDGEKWESVALLDGAVPKPSYRYDPAFTVLPDGSLMVSAMGAKTVAWFSGDGLLSCQASNPIPSDKAYGRQFQNGLLGTSEAPYADWKWKSIQAAFSAPNLLRLPDQRIVASVRMSHKKNCISLCELDLATGQLREFMDIPVQVENLIQAAYHGQIASLAFHDGYLWVGYHATSDGKLCLHITKVKVS